LNKRDHMITHKYLKKKEWKDNKDSY